MLLEHYSAKPLGVIQSRLQDPPDMPFQKPRGLWVSVKGEDDWPSWCRIEEFGLDRLEHCTRIELQPGARIVTIDTPDKMRWLESYGIEIRLPGAGSIGLAIDWGDVARDWQGIIIAPYQWEERLSARWYYPWDCASGCIWDASAISQAVPIEQTQAETSR